MTRNVKIAAAIVGVLVVAGVVALVSAGGSAKANAVRFQNVSDPGPKPFTAPATSPKIATSPTLVSVSSTAVASAQNGDFTAKNSSCDREKLITELNLDPAKRSAWADVEGIGGDGSSVADFIRTTQASTLTQDTQVTDHSWVNGKVHAFQAVLPQGTQVLVNDGKPVARCISGNPLSDPEELAAKTKCINCPTGFQPPRKCSGDCSKHDPQAPPVQNSDTGTTTPTPKPKPGDPISEARKKLDDCRQQKGGLEQCKDEYEKVRSQCAANPLNAACDSSVCFDVITTVNGASDGCSSYLDRTDILGACLKLETAAKQTCLKALDDLQKKCGADPTGADCKVDPNIKIFKSRQACAIDPGRPDCGAVISACKTNPQFGCEPLQAKIDQIRKDCAQDPNKPSCAAVQKLPQTFAPTQPQQLQSDQGQQQQGSDTTGAATSSTGTPDESSSGGTDQGGGSSATGGGTDQGGGSTTDGGGGDQGQGGQ